MKKHGNMFQTREQVKSPETNLNETDKSHLSHRVQHNAQKDAHRGQESSAWAKKDFSTEINDIIKYQTDSIEIKNKITKLKNSIERTNSRPDQMIISVN